MNSMNPERKAKIIYVLVILYILQVLFFLKFGIFRIHTPPICTVFFLLFIVTCIKFRIDHFPDHKSLLTFTPLILSLYFLILIFNKNGDIWWGLTPFYAKPDYIPFLFLSIFQWLSFPNLGIYINDTIIKISDKMFSCPRRRILLKLAFYVSLFCVFMIFRERGISRDGIDWAQTTENNTWYLYLREIYTMLIFRVFYIILKGFDFSARNAIAIASSVSGVVFLWIITKIYSARRDAGKGASIYYLLGFFSSYGLMQIFFGQIEVYGLFIATVCGYFLLCISYLDGKIKLRFIGIYFAFMMGIHIATIWLLPSVLILPWIKGKGENLQRENNIREALIMILFMIVSGAVLLFPIVCFYYDFSILNLWERCLQSVTDTPDGRVFLSLDNIFSIKHIIDVTNIFFYNFGGIIFILFYLFLQKSFWRNWGKKDYFILSALIPSLIFALSYRLGRKALEDWNSFSLLTFIVTFFAMHGILNRGEGNLRKSDSIDMETMILIFNCENLYLILSKHRS